MSSAGETGPDSPAKFLSHPFPFFLAFVALAEASSAGLAGSPTGAGGSARMRGRLESLPLQTVPPAPGKEKGRA